MNNRSVLSDFVRRHRLFSWVIGGLVALALLAPLIANDLPLYACYQNRHCFPAFNPEGKILKNGEIVLYRSIRWKEEECFRIFALCTYSPQTLDLPNADYQSPFGRQVRIHEDGTTGNLSIRFRHYLGTDKLGRDVLSGLIHGLRTSLFTALLAMGIALLIALPAGALSAFFGNDGIKISRASVLSFFLSLPFIYLYAFELQRFSFEDRIFEKTLITLLIIGFIVLAFFLLSRLLLLIPLLKTRVSIPVDNLVTRTTGLIAAMPRLIIVLSLGALFKPSGVTLAVIIGVTSWTEMARLLRAGILEVKEQPYVEAARVLGFSEWRVLFRHILPNALTPVITSFAFGVAATILVESSLTFLGIGLPPETVSWGSLLAQGRENIQAWWLILFPSIAVFFTVLLMNRAGDILHQYVNPRIHKA